MSDRTVSQSITHRHLVSLLPQATVLEAARIMTKANTGSVLIMDINGELLFHTLLSNHSCVPSVSDCLCKP